MTYEELGNYDPIYQEWVNQIAKDYKISPKNLWNMYREVMSHNLYQDLDDIAQENIEELKEMEE